MKPQPIFPRSVRPGPLRKDNERKFAALELETVNLAGSFSGYASVFGERDQANDIVDAGAFAHSLEKRGAGGVRMLFQHDATQPIGVWQSISEDGYGLRVKGRIITTTSKGAEVLELMRAGALDGLSIGFRTLRARTDSLTGCRHIKAADLWEISVVTFPLLETARVSCVKGAPGAAYPTIREFEKWLMQDAGLTRKAARTVIREGYQSLVDKPGAVTAAVRETGLAQTIRAATALLINQTGNPIR